MLVLFRTMLRLIISIRFLLLIIAFFVIRLLLLVPLLVPLGFSSELPLGGRLTHDGHAGQHRGARGPDARRSSGGSVPPNDQMFCASLATGNEK